MADAGGGVLRPFSILLRCGLCGDPGPEPFEAGVDAEGRALMNRHLKHAHGLTFDPPTLEAWLDVVRRG